MPEWGYSSADASSPPAPTTGAGGVSYPVEDFRPLLDLDRRGLTYELVLVHAELANLANDIAFAKANGDPRAHNPHRIIMEGAKEAAAEKKWLILKLLEGMKG
jgi:hypothetical protein